MTAGLAAELAVPDGVPPIRVLVVDDEAELAELVATTMRIAGCETAVAPDAATAIRKAPAFRPDIAILDFMLPDLDGAGLLRRLRSQRPDLPVIFLTARGDVQHRVEGLRAGADDYIAKPFSLEELIARIGAVLRRSGRLAEQPRVLVFADLRLDPDSHEVHRAENRIELTPTEFDLLQLLMINPRAVMSKAQILDRVWDYDFAGRSSIVELYIGYLRRKIDKGHSPLIHTVRGVGYVLREAPGHRDPASASPPPRPGAGE